MTYTPNSGVLATGPGYIPSLTTAPQTGGEPFVLTHRGDADEAQDHTLSYVLNSLRFQAHAMEFAAEIDRFSSVEQLVEFLLYVKDVLSDFSTRDFSQPGRLPISLAFPANPFPVRVVSGRGGRLTAHDRAPG